MSVAESPPTIAEAARLIASRQLSPVELTTACLARIEALDPHINSFLLTRAEAALAEAAAAEQEIARGDYRGPLHGIPIAHKDIVETAGIRTTAHSKLLRDFVPLRDATIVRRLAEAGPIMLGKTATHEFAMGGPSFDLPWPPARNPWNTDHFTGGSSSGTGAAVAAGLILGGSGSDTGGSIRLPPAYFGVTRLKPTYGRVSRYRVLPLAYSLDHLLPLARTGQDGAFLGAGDYVQALRLRRELIEEMTAAMRDLDVLVTGITPGEAPRIDEKPGYESFQRPLMMPFNVTGQPSMAVRCGRSASGLPLSLQIAGRPFDEATVLRVGHAYEQATDWHRRRPPLAAA